MASNVDLFGQVRIQALQKPDYEEEDTLFERWQRFHDANPHIYESLRDMALALKRRGFSKCGIALLWERLRWLSYIQTQGEDEYKLSNSHRAYYSRLLMKNEPELEDFFNLRRQTTEHPIFW